MDTSRDAYVAAYQRQDHKTCAKIVNWMRGCGEIDERGRPLDTRDDDEKDDDEERQEGWAK